MRPDEGHRLFADRVEAGHALADRLEELGAEVDLVLAIPRGGLPLGEVVADRLGVPLEVIVVKKIGAPGRPELALGAAAPDGTVWLNEDLVDQFDLSDQEVSKAVEGAVEEAARKARAYREAREETSLAGKRVLIVDDGIATGATMRACVRVASARGASSVVLGVPVAPPGRLDALGEKADALVCLQSPAGFRSVGQFYDRFDQVTHEEAVGALRRASGSPPHRCGG